MKEKNDDLVRDQTTPWIVKDGEVEEHFRPKTDFEVVEEIAKELGFSNFKSGMPGFGETLTDAEIWDVLAYIRESWPPRERKAQASRNPPHE